MKVYPEEVVMGPRSFSAQAGESDSLLAATNGQKKEKLEEV
jgi:hypothetical protein